MILLKFLVLILCTLVYSKPNEMKSTNQIKYEALRLNYLKHLGFMYQYYLNRKLPVNIKFHISQTNLIIQQIKDLISKDPSVQHLSDDKIVHDFFKNPFILVPRLKTINQMKYDAWRKVRIHFEKILNELRINGIQNKNIGNYIIFSSAVSQINDIIRDLEKQDPNVIKYAEDLSSYDRNPMEDDEDPDLKTIDKFQQVRRSFYIKLTRF